MSQGKDKEIKSKVQELYGQIVTGINQGTMPIPNDLKDGFLRLETLSEAEQIALIKKLDKTEGLSIPMLRFIEIFKLQQLPLFEVLPKDILNHTYTFNKDEKTLSSLALASKEHYKLFQSDRILSKLQQQVAYAAQDKVESLFDLLKKHKREDEIQTLLCSDGTFTDYSGRTFHCTAYEYAFWAKDTHMCRMLERHMDEKTKAFMLKRCEAIEKDGLKYTQNGEKKCSSHFDFEPLITALKEYIDGYDDNYYDWGINNSDALLSAAWLKVGISQRDVPAHVIHEYCRLDRSFEKPTFKEDTLPRVVTCYNYLNTRDESLFPLVISRSSGLGVNFALIRAASKVAWVGSARAVSKQWAFIDLSAISLLDKVKTEDIKQSLENLKPSQRERKLVF